MRIRPLIQTITVVALLFVPRWATGETPDSAGLHRDTWYFLGYQWVTIGLLYAAPESVSGWTDEQKEGYSMSVWRDNVTHPQMDSDDFYINYVLHPYWGAAYYVRAQERGYNRRQSFWYSVMLSSIYEFGAEALFEEPSIQDIIVTPVLGSLLGNYFMQVRENVGERENQLGYRKTTDKWLCVITDPLGSLNQRVDDWLGLDVRLQIRPYIGTMRYGTGMPPGPVAHFDGSVYGLEFRLEW